MAEKIIRMQEEIKLRLEETVTTTAKISMITMPAASLEKTVENQSFM